MSELIQKHDNRATIRWKLLTGASALAMVAYVSSAEAVNAEDAGKPLIWIELGGQLERQTGQGDTYAPPFVLNNPDSPAFNPVSPLHYERSPLYSTGLNGQITFQPSESDWQFSASIRYGRSGGRKNVDPGSEITEQVNDTRFPGYHYSPSCHCFRYNIPPPIIHRTLVGLEYAPTQIDQQQKHVTVDFMVGKDVGLGLFGGHASETVSAGVRFAQFRSSLTATIHARPEVDFPIHTSHFLHNLYPSFPFQAHQYNYHTYAKQFRAKRDFQGVGPSIAWKSSVPVAGNTNDEALTIDWGINAALLFGRQKVGGSHQTSGHARLYPSNPYITSNSFDRSRRVTVSNVGGTLGMSLVFPNAKVSIGYRGDFFFGAMDIGNDTRKTGITGFFGPFASISFGIGD